MIIHKDILQRSYDWHKLRQSRLTASHARTWANGTKEGKCTLCWQKAKERIDRPDIVINDIAASQAIQDGIDREPQAIAQYAWETGNEVQSVGFIEYDDYFGCSPDGHANFASQRHRDGHNTASAGSHGGA